MNAIQFFGSYFNWIDPSLIDLYVFFGVLITVVIDDINSFIVGKNIYWVAIRL